MGARMYRKGLNYGIDAPPGVKWLFVWAAAQPELTSGRPWISRATTPAWLNAVLEGVEKRVDILSAAARSLPLDGDSFDTILSNFVLHNIHGKSERLKALQEIARVLAPGGRVILADIFHTGEYSKALSASGLAGVSRSSPRFLVCPPARRVIARKPPRS